jgi:hypothetical protein
MDCWPTVTGKRLDELTPGIPVIERDSGFAFTVSSLVPQVIDVVGLEDNGFRFQVAQRDYPVLAIAEPLSIRPDPAGPVGKDAPSVDAGFRLFVAGDDLLIVVRAIEGGRWLLVDLKTATCRRADMNVTPYFGRWDIGLQEPNGAFRKMHSFEAR